MAALTSISSNVVSSKAFSVSTHKAQSSSSCRTTTSLLAAPCASVHGKKLMTKVRPNIQCFLWGCVCHKYEYTCGTKRYEDAEQACSLEKENKGWWWSKSYIKVLPTSRVTDFICMNLQQKLTVEVIFFHCPVYQAVCRQWCTPAQISMSRHPASSQKKSRCIVTKASSSSDEIEEQKVAPLVPQSPAGQFLSQMLGSYPHLFSAAADQQLERLVAERDQQEQEGSATELQSDNLVLYR